jgi:hypothetical protein
MIYLDPNVTREKNGLLLNESESFLAMLAPPLDRDLDPLIHSRR